MYAFEKALRLGPRVSLRRMDQDARRICRRLRLDPPEIRDDRRERGLPSYDPTDDSIHIPKHSRYQRVFLHELAHHAAPRSVGHGPGFLRLLLDLLAFEMGFAPAELMRQANALGLRVAARADCPWPSDAALRRIERLEFRISELSRKRDNLLLRAAGVIEP